MAQLSMQQVKELRERTQAGLNDCRTALIESEGDIEKAVEIILKKGLAKSAKRAGAIATEGAVLTQVAEDGRSGVMVEVNIQTDFAARNADFQAFAQQVLEAASRAKPGAELSAEPYPGGTGSIEDNRQLLVAKLGENVTVRRWERVSVDGPGRVQSYVHMGGKIGVLVAARTTDDRAAGHGEFVGFMDNVAMQIAAMSPQYLSREAVPEEAKRKQSEIFDAQLVEEGKPEQVRPRIIQGKLAKWMKEVCLLEQQSVLAANQSVEQTRALASKAIGSEITLLRFVRFERGEGIDKPHKPDFAEEVAKLAGGN
jgi:elongation factor Ts